MKPFKMMLASLICLSLAVSPALAVAPAQDGREALQRGYRTGYSDGYMAGYRDSIDGAPRGFEKHPDYAKADRAYSPQYGSIEDFKDGYRQGFEAGYQTGFDKKPFNAAVPDALERRESSGLPSSEQKESPREENVSPPNDEDVIVIKKDTELILELEDAISTETNRVGDKFRAKVVSPIELTGMFVEGHISKMRKPGRVRRKAEMLLSFDRILVNDERWSNIAAILTEVLPVKSDNVRKVDMEGTVESKVATRSDAARVGAAAGVGAIVGGTVAGPAGIAVGAGVGAALGVGSVVVVRGRHVNLNRLQQLRLRTTFEGKIR